MSKCDCIVASLAYSRLCEVRIHGLKTAGGKALNGEFGVIVRFNQKGRMEARTERPGVAASQGYEVPEYVKTTGVR